MERTKQLLTLLPDVVTRLSEAKLTRDGEADTLNFLLNVVDAEVNAVIGVIAESKEQSLAKNREHDKLTRDRDLLTELAKRLESEGWGYKFSSHGNLAYRLDYAVRDLERIATSSKDGYTAMLEEMRSIVKAFALLADSALGGQTHTVKNGRLHSIKDVAETSVTRIEEMQRRGVDFWHGYTLSQGSHELRDARGQLMVLERENKKLLEQLQAVETKKESPDAEEQPF